MAQTVKNLPVMWEIQVQSLGWEDPLEKEIATHLSILAWRIPRAAQSEESQRVDSLEKTLMLGGIGGRRKRGRQRMRWLNGITDSMDVKFE